MKYGKTIFLFSAVLVISLSLPAIVCAATGFTLKPKAAAQWQVDSNYYLTQDREREVYTYTLEPGIEMGLKTAKSDLMLYYTLSAYYYDDRDTVPSNGDPINDDYIGHTGIFKAQHQTLDRLLLTLSDTFYLTRDAVQADEFSNSISREKFYVNTLSPTVIYQFGSKFEASLGYSHKKIDYSSENNEDSIENRGIFKLIYNLNSKNSLNLEYQHWRQKYDSGIFDYTSNQAKLIFEKRFRIINISAGVGYQNRSFDDTNLDDIDVVTYHLNLDGESSLENRRTKISLKVEQNFNDQSVEENYFTATRFTLSGEHDFSRRLSGDVSASYQISDYVNSKRKDDTYEVEGNIRYMLARWMFFSIGGGYETRNSSLFGGDYENKFFISRLEFVYNLGGGQ